MSTAAIGAHAVALAALPPSTTTRRMLVAQTMVEGVTLGDRRFGGDEIPRGRSGPSDSHAIRCASHLQKVRRDEVDKLALTFGLSEGAGEWPLNSPINAQPAPHRVGFVQAQFTGARRFADQACVT